MCCLNKIVSAIAKETLQMPSIPIDQTQLEVRKRMGPSMRK